MKVRGNMKKTYDEYYKVCDILKQLPLCTYIPSDYDLDYMSDYFEETFKFIVYIAEYHAVTKNEYSKRQLKKVEDMLYDRLELVEKTE